MKTLVRSILVIALCALISGASSAEPFPRPQGKLPLKVYQCLRATETPVIDGVLDDPAWDAAEWSDDFADISGEGFPTPEYRTRVKMLWDADCLYFAAELEEPHLQASFTERDSYIYRLDNDFEIFLDPDGDTHHYFELEMNALNTVWDLLLTRPYRDGARALDGWDFKGLKTAVHLNGTLNDGSDVDEGWTLEIAIPFKALAEAAGTACPPNVGDYWRLNFSRVAWRFDWTDGGYVKSINPETGNHYPENNWVWRPQGLIAMHYPERWGYLAFVDDKPDPALDELIAERDEAQKLLFELYYLQRDYQAEHGGFTGSLTELDWNAQDASTGWLRPGLSGCSLGFVASVALPSGGVMRVDQTGRTWIEPDEEAAP